MMEDEVVRRHQWLTRDEFLDLLGATHLIPGPNSTEMAIHVGHRRAGWPGLLVAGACFILPSALIVMALAAVYVRFGQLPEAGGILNGIRPVIIAVVAQALWRLGRVALKTKMLAVVGAVAAAACLMGINELVVLFGAGLLLPMARSVTAFRQPGNGPWISALLPAFPAALAAGPAAGGATAFGLWPLFLFFAKVGSVLFGSGYVLLAFLHADLVGRFHWLTEDQLLDAIAVGQVTPGPVFTAATFIGYLLAGTLGATVATLGIFLPAFCFVAISGPLVPLLRRSRWAGAFLDGVNVASLALMAVVTGRLAAAALTDALAIGLTLASEVLLLRFRINIVWLVLGGGLFGSLSLFASGK